MEKIGIGIIGSRFAADLHAHALSKLRGVKCEIVAVCSKTKESAEAFARKFNIPHVYTDHRAMLERKDIQLVTLPVVTSLHHTLAIDCRRRRQAHRHGEAAHRLLRRGRAPCPGRQMLAEAMKNADAVAEACRRNKVTICGYAENFVYAPPVAKLRRLMDAGGGTLLDLRAEESHSGSARRVLAPLGHRGRRLHAADGLAPHRRRDPPEALRGAAEIRASPSGSSRSWPTWRSSASTPAVQAEPQEVAGAPPGRTWRTGRPPSSPSRTAPRRRSCRPT
ncbi:MAG: Gfo/Idh/MocA family oxidoreductase [Ignavibacteriales bacterium]|nr:Gfo/Idh/MocA family oxidoreductase [Ignavibacteriales bacterium]